MPPNLPLVFLPRGIAEIVVFIDGRNLQAAVVKPLPAFLRQLTAVALQSVIAHGLDLPQRLRLGQVSLGAGFQYMGVKSVQLSHNKSFLLMICVLWVFLPRSKAVHRCFFLQKR